MTPSRHLTDEVIHALATGALPEALALVAASHVTLCDDCRAALEAHEAVGGDLLASVAPVPPVPDSLNAVLARLDAAPPPVPARPVGILPLPLRDYVGGDLDAVRWRRVGGGIRQAILPTARGAVARLLAIPGGAAMPEHGHRGLELTLVLHGAFRDGATRFARGDVEVASTAEPHVPVAEAGADCICLAATDAPLRFTGWLPRLVQPLIGI